MVRRRKRARMYLLNCPECKKLGMLPAEFLKELK